MSQFYDFFSPRNLLYLDFLLNFRQAADILADARDVAFNAFEVFFCFIEQASSLVFQRVACDTVHLIQ